MSDLREIVKIINQIARDNSESNSKEGEVVKLNDNGTHNIKLTEENGVEYIIQNRWSDDGKSKYPVGTRVIMTLPDGSLDRSVIRGNANFNLPSSPTVRHFSTAPPAPPAPVTGDIYLCCPNESLIKVYSADGTPGTDISPEVNAMYNICTDGTYLYFSSSYAYGLYKVKPDGSDFAEIVLQSRYYSAYGLAIDPTNTYLYQVDGSTYCIARITIADGTIDNEWKEITEGEAYSDVYDICGDDSYIYILTEISIKIYNYSGVYQSEIEVSGYNKITTDGTNLYLSSDSTVGIYTVAGTLVTIIGDVV